MKENKKHLIHLVSNKEWGGGEQYVYDICRNLGNEEYLVSLFCRPIKQVFDRLSTLNLPLYELPLKGVADVFSACCLSRHLRQGECIIHCHNFKDAFTAAYARFLAGNKNVRIVLTRHLVRKGKTSWLYRWLYREIDTVVFVSELAKREFLRSNPKIDIERLVVIPNSIVLPVSLPIVNVREEFTISQNCVLAMYHGRLAAEKGLEVLIDAMRMLKGKSICLLLIGRGEDAYVDSLRKCVEEYGLKERVLFAGFRAPVLPYLSACDFGVLPSIVQESSSLSCMEYMSQGRTVIATNNGGQAEYLVHGQNALLVPPNDVRALAKSLTELTDNALKCKALGQQALIDYTEKLNYNKFLGLIRKVYEGRTLA